MTSLAFPPVARPEVSIVVVTHGAWALVDEALAALRANTEPIYELIVVDNASPDDTAGRLRAEVANARIVFNAANRGFGPAANQAAGLARGGALVFLNSDAFVHPGWLPPLLAALEGDAGVGAVSPAILNRDGTLQEAGGLVFRDGSTSLYGMGDDAGALPYRFRRFVDYASAACLLVRRSVFEDVGGFDPVFAPAYYEDVDLCFAMRSRGRLTLFEPRSSVTHVMGASSERSTAIALSAEHRAVFSGRWRDALASRPERRGADATPIEILRSRDADAVPRVLVLAGTPAEEGEAAAREARGIVSRAREGRVTLLAPSELAESEELLALGVELARPRPDESSWLLARSFHYDLVVGTKAALARHRDVLESAQPQAATLELGSRPRGSASGDPA